MYDYLMPHIWRNDTFRHARQNNLWSTQTFEMNCDEHVKSWALKEIDTSAQKISTQTTHISNNCNWVSKWSDGHSVLWCGDLSSFPYEENWISYKVKIPKSKTHFIAMWLMLGNTLTQLTFPLCLKSILSTDSEHVCAHAGKVKK